MKKYQYEKPIEMPRGSHYGSDYWVVYSKKLDRRVQCYSMLEFANFLQIEMNPAIEYFCEQPLKITLPDYPKKSAIFDFWIQYSDGSTEFQETKYSKDLNDDERTIQQIELQKEWCMRNNQNYRVITEKDLLDPFLFNNLKKLHFIIANTDHLFNPNMEILRCIKKHQTISIEQLSDMLEYSLYDLFEEIAIQFYIGTLTMDLSSRPLDIHMEVSLLCKNINII